MKKIFTFIIIIATCNAGFTQEESKLFIKTGISPGFAKINYDFSSDVLNYGQNFGFTADVQFGYTVNQWFSISAGAGISHISSSLSMPAWTGSFDDTDIDGDAYVKNIIAENVFEDQVYMLLNVPLSFNFNYPITRDINLYASLGNYFSFPVVTKYDASGLFSYNGYYSEYNVTLTNIPEYGFYEDVSLSSSEKNDIKSFVLSGFGNLGLSFPIPESPVTIFLGSTLIFNYTSLNKDNTADYLVSPDPDSYNSLVGSSKSTVYQFSGIQIGFEYKL